MKAIALGAFGAALLASAASAAPLNATTIGSAEVSSVGQVRTRNLHRLVSHGQHPFELGMALCSGAEQASAVACAYDIEIKELFSMIELPIPKSAPK